jgi:hypothetical protein
MIRTQGTEPRRPLEVSFCNSLALGGTQVAATRGASGRSHEAATASTSGQTPPLWSCPTAATVGSGEQTGGQGFDFCQYFRQKWQIFYSKHCSLCKKRIVTNISISLTNFWAKTFILKS